MRVVPLALLSFLMACQSTRREDVASAVRDGLISAPTSLELAVPGAALGQQTLPAVATSGTVALAVWADAQRGDIVGTRIDATGVVLDLGGLAIGARTGVTETSPAVAFDGTNFIVAWTDNNDIRAARVSATGTVLDNPGVLIASGAAQQRFPTVAAGGGVVLFAWEEGATGATDVLALRTAADLSPNDPTPITLSSATGAQTAPAATWAGGTFFVAWVDGSATPLHLFGARVPTGMGAINQNQLTSDATLDETDPAVAFDGTNVLVVWTAGAVTNQQVRYARFSPMGAAVGATVNVSPLTFTNRMPSVVFDGTNYFLTWIFQGNSTDVSSRVVSPAGVQIGTDLAVSRAYGNESTPAVTTLGTSVLAVWEDSRSNDLNIVGARVSGTTVLEPTGFVVSTGANVQSEVSVATSSTEALFVWSDRRGVGDPSIWGQRTNLQGAPIQATAFPISTVINPQQKTAVVFDGLTYVVAWEDQRTTGLDVYVARVTRGGVLIEDAGVAAPNGSTQYEPALATDGVGTAMVVYAERQADSGFTDIMAARFIDGGFVGRTQVTATSLNERLPSVAAGPGEYFVVWTAAVTDGGVFGARVSANGALVDGTPLRVSQESSIPTTPSVARGSSSYLVVWRGGPGATGTVFAAKVVDGGVVQGPFAVSTSVTSTLSPDVIFDGEHFLVGWQSAVPGSELTTATVREATGAIERVERQTDSVAERELSLSNAGSGLALAASVRFSATDVTNRVAVRSITTLRAGATCVAPAECATNFCEGGTCCNTACPNGTCLGGTCTIVTNDGGMLDAGNSDSGVADAGTTTDAGSSSDAGTASDAGGVDPDAGTEDAGAPQFDAGQTTGTETDGGAPDAGPRRSFVVRGCSQSGMSPMWIAMLLLVFPRKTRAKRAA